MELDEFKQQWVKSTDASQPVNTNIMELINNKSSSPLAALEKKLKINFYIFPFVALLFAGKLIGHATLIHNATSWLLFGILLTEFVFYTFSYIMVKRIQQPGGKTKENIRYRINTIQHTIRWQVIINEVLYTIMAIVLEISMRNQWDSDFGGWYSVSAIIRYGVYLLILIFIFIMKRNSNQKFYGQYLAKLNDLIRQIN
jgi:hypothetical protein